MTPPTKLSAGPEPSAELKAEIERMNKLYPKIAKAVAAGKEAQAKNLIFALMTHSELDGREAGRLEGEAAGERRERQRVVRWLRDTDPRMVGASLAYRCAETFERGEHLAVEGEK